MCDKRAGRRGDLHFHPVCCSSASCPAAHAVLCGPATPYTPANSNTNAATLTHPSVHVCHQPPVQQLLPGEGLAGEVAAARRRQRGADGVGGGVLHPHVALLVMPAGEQRVGRWGRHSEVVEHSGERAAKCRV